MAQPPGTVPSACVMERWLKSKHGEMAQHWQTIFAEHVGKHILCNVNPGLINHGYLLRGFSSNSHNLILRWYPPIYVIFFQGKEKGGMGKGERGRDKEKEKGKGERKRDSERRRERRNEKETGTGNRMWIAPSIGYHCVPCVLGKE